MLLLLNYLTIWLNSMHFPLLSEINVWKHLNQIISVSKDSVMLLRKFKEYASFLIIYKKISIYYIIISM